jgi:hypothetical protein
MFYALYTVHCALCALFYLGREEKEASTQMSPATKLDLAGDGRALGDVNAESFRSVTMRIPDHSLVKMPASDGLVAAVSSVNERVALRAGDSTDDYVVRDARKDRALSFDLPTLPINNPRQRDNFAILDATIPIAQYEALRDLYDATSGSSWGSGSAWDFTGSQQHDPCSENWQGIVCTCTSGLSARCDISELSSPGALAGTLPESLGSLTALISLDLSVSD